jgi:RNA polymerase sigma-70 factor (TIGR02957 family)
MATAPTLGGMPAVEQELEWLRRRAFAIAYRMLGTVTEAEDVAQEALLRLHRERTQGVQVAAPQAFVATVATRLAIDALRSARQTRESYVGEWLPEPLLSDAREDPAERAELADSLSLAFLVLLERLTPQQRAVFLLRDVFDYSYSEIAGIVGRTEDATRQLASRARRQLEARRPRRSTHDAEHAVLAERFFAAVEDGDLTGLETMLAEDIVLHGDGGGKAPALARPLQGRVRVAGTLRNWAKTMRRMPGVVFERAEVNAAPGAVLRDSAGRVVSAMALEIEDGRIVAIRAVVNPDKLGHLGRTTDLRALLKGAGAATPGSTR